MRCMKRQKKFLSKAVVVMTIGVILSGSMIGTTDAAMRNRADILDMRPDDSTAVKVLKGIGGVLAALTPLTYISCDNGTSPMKIVNASVTAAAVPFSGGTTLNLQLTSNNYSFVGDVDPNFSTADFSGITYTLTSTNPTRTSAQLAAHITDGKLAMAAFDTNDYPTITQTFSYNGQVVGSRKFVALILGTGFENLYAYKPTEISGDMYDTDFVDIFTIPAITLTLKKEI